MNVPDQTETDVPITNVTSSPMMVARPLLIVMALALLALLMWYVFDVFLLIFAGILLAILLYVPSNWLSRLTGLGYRWCLTITVVLLLSGAVIGIWSLASSLMQQVDELQRTVPRAIETLQAKLERSELGNATLKEAKERSNGSNFGGEMVGGAANAVSLTLGLVVSCVFVLFLGLFLAIEPALYQRGFLMLVPSQHCQRAAELLDELGITLRWWLLGTLFSMSVVGVLSGIGLWVLGIPNAILIGILTALLTFIPNLGPLLSVLLPALLALLHGPLLVLYVILLYLGVQTIETYGLTPLVQRKIIHLPPAILISTQMIMGVLAGMLGVMLATPLIVCVIVLIKGLYVQNWLGKEIH